MFFVLWIKLIPFDMFYMHWSDPVFPILISPIFTPVATPIPAPLLTNNPMRLFTLSEYFSFLFQFTMFSLTFEYFYIDFYLFWILFFPFNWPTAATHPSELHLDIISPGIFYLTTLTPYTHSFEITLLCAPTAHRTFPTISQFNDVCLTACIPRRLSYKTAGFLFLLLAISHLILRE